MSIVWQKIFALDSDEDPHFELDTTLKGQMKRKNFMIFQRISEDSEEFNEGENGESGDSFIVEDSDSITLREIALKYLDTKKKFIKFFDKEKLREDETILTRNLKIPKPVDETRKNRPPRKKFTLPPLPPYANEKSIDKTYLNSLQKEEREKLLELEKMVNEMNKCEIPLKYKILQSELDINEKARIIKTIENENENSWEYNKISHYVNTVLSIPFNVNKNIDLKGKSVNSFILEASKVLESIIYGHENAKLRDSADSYPNDK